MNLHLHFPLLTFLVLFATACGPQPGRMRMLHNPNLSLARLAEAPDPENALFASYSPSGQSRWNNGWPWMLDLSGIAWDSPRTATAISPRHVVMAAHFQRQLGDIIVFHDRAGRPHPRRLIGTSTLSKHGFFADVAVGLLDRPLPASIRTYFLPAPGSDPSGHLALVTDKMRRLYFHRIGHLSSSTLALTHDPQLPSYRAKQLITGDSGNPSFVVSGGELVLVETHTGGGPGSGPWYGSADLQQALREAMSALDPAYTFQTLPLDR